jgi:hypothetical protein
MKRLGTTRRGRVAVLVLPLLLCGAARPGITVSEFQGGGGRKRAAKVRIALIKALEDADALEVVPFSRVSSAAARAGIRGAQLRDPLAAGRAARAQGAEVVVFGRLFSRSGEAVLAVDVCDTSGRKLWRKEVALEGGELLPGTAAKFARAIAVLLGVQVAASEDSAAPPVPRPKPRRAPEESDDRGADPQEAEATVPEEEGAPAPRKRSTASEASAESDAPEADSRPSVGESEERAEDDDGPSPPLAKFSVGMSTTFRSYRMCPEVKSCEETPPQGSGSPVKYSTDRPYAGLRLALDLFPFHARESRVRGLGLAASFARSFFLRTRYLDADRAEQSFGSAQQRLQLDVVFRMDYGIDGVGDGDVTFRAGYLFHVFLVDDNPKIVESRREGVVLSLGATLPINRFLRAEAQGLLVPLGSPGEVERKAYGSAASGGGYGVRGGLSSNFGRPRLGLELAAFLELLHFGDRYQNPEGTHPEFARALEDYTGFLLLVRSGF